MSTNSLGTDALAGVSTIPGVLGAEITSESDAEVTLSYEWDGRADLNDRPAFGQIPCSKGLGLQALPGLWHLLKIKIMTDSLLLAGLALTVVVIALLAFKNRKCSEQSADCEE